MYLKINEVDRAYEKLQEALVSEAKHTNCILAVGAIQQTRNDIDLALNTYKNMPNIQNEGFEIWSNIGLCFYRKNKLIAVIFNEDIKLGISTWPKHWLIFIPFYLNISVYIMPQKSSLVMSFELQYIV